MAKGIADVVKGIRLKDSEEGWQLRFPGPVCAVTRHVSVDGRTAIAFPGERPEKGGKEEAALVAPCDRIAVFDIDTGRKLWDKKLLGPSGSAMSVNVTMTRGAVLATTGQASVAYDMTSGECLWADTASSNCTDMGFAGGRSLIALVQCGDSADPVFRVRKVAPRAGRPVWTYKVADGIKGVHLASSSPPVIAVAAGEVRSTTLITLSDRGKAAGHDPSGGRPLRTRLRRGLQR
ncbi:PQQ-binding-like beta-propeller repeat protein [Streptomyces sp. G5(2025)]|uniref:outer membrane protein assembly factor BamB family protein n=1 Tax=Streptomyces sp. G5(2025) TaxID=3406628 RepID=UPI003C1EBCC9